MEQYRNWNQKVFQTTEPSGNGRDFDWLCSAATMETCCTALLQENMLCEAESTVIDSFQLLFSQLAVKPRLRHWSKHVPPLGQVSSEEHLLVWKTLAELLCLSAHFSLPFAIFFQILEALPACNCSLYFNPPWTVPAVNFALFNLILASAAERS